MLRGPRPLRRAPARAARAVAALALSVGAGASCDPCAGVATCVGSPELRVGGQLVGRPLGYAVEGVRVEITPTGGAELTTRTSLTGTTDSRGFFQVSGAASTIGAMSVDIRVTPPPPDRPYTVSNYLLRTSAVRGDGNWLGRWVVDPTISTLVEFRDLRTNGPLENAEVTWRRQAGANLDVPTSTQTTNSVGIIFLNVAPDALAPVIFQFDVFVPGTGLTVRVPGVELSPSQVDTPPVVRKILFVDPTRAGVQSGDPALAIAPR